MERNSTIGARLKLLETTKPVHVAKIGHLHYEIFSDSVLAITYGI